MNIHPKGELDMTTLIYQSKEDWLKAIREKYGARVEQFCRERTPGDKPDLDVLGAVKMALGLN